MPGDYFCLPDGTCRNCIVFEGEQIGVKLSALSHAVAVDSELSTVEARGNIAGLLCMVSSSHLIMQHPGKAPRVCCLEWCQPEGGSLQTIRSRLRNVTCDPVMCIPLASSSMRYVLRLLGVLTGDRWYHSGKGHGV